MWSKSNFSFSSEDSHRTWQMQCFCSGAKLGYSSSSCRWDGQRQYLQDSGKLHSWLQRMVQLVGSTCSSIQSGLEIWNFENANFTLFFVSLSFIPCRYGSWLFLYKGDLVEAFTSSVSICIYPRQDYTRKVLYAIQLIRNLRISPLLVYPGRVPRLIVAFGCWADDTCCSRCWKRSSKVDPIFVTKRQVLQIPFQSPKSDVFNGCCPLSNASHRVRISNSSSLNAFKIECGISKPNESQQPITTYGKSTYFIDFPQGGFSKTML